MLRCKWFHPIVCCRPFFKATWPWLRHGHQLFDGPQLAIPYVYNGAKLFTNPPIFNPFLISRGILCNISNYPSKSKNENLEIFWSVIKMLQMRHIKYFGLSCRQRLLLLRRFLLLHDLWNYPWFTYVWSQFQCLFTITHLKQNSNERIILKKRSVLVD